MTSSAKHPKTANMTFCPPWRTSALKASTGGITIAARAARRSAARPGSAGAVTEKRGRRGGGGAFGVGGVGPPGFPPSFFNTLVLHCPSPQHGVEVAPIPGKQEY